MMRIVLLIVMMATAVGAQTPDRIIVPHDLHFENDVECAVCHEGVEASTDAVAAHRPDMDVCADCHDVDDDDTCSMCHSDLDTAGEWTPPVPAARLFSHAAHIDSGMDCAACHGAATAPMPMIPAKARCRDCHETADEYTGCRLCHAANEDLVPDNHRVGWDYAHGLQADLQKNRCDACHGPSTCSVCHAGDNVQPRVHDLGFAFSHALQARGHEFECASCHQDQQDCVACHRAEHVLPQNHSRADWMRTSDGGNHAIEARFDIEGCIACHDAGAADPICARCH
jgi:hypothetical protein